MSYLQNIYQKWRRYRMLNRTQSEVMQEYLKEPQPSSSLLIDECEFLVLDIETTGLSIEKDTILSVAYVPVVQRQIQLNAARHMLVKSDTDVGQSATIHGIHDQDIKTQGVALDIVMKTLLNDLEGKVLVVHYAQLDYGMLDKTCRALYGVSLLCPMIDTLALEYQRYKKFNVDNIPPMRLDVCRERYGLPRYRAHNAMVDAIATAELWLAQSAHMQGNKQLSLGFFR